MDTETRNLLQAIVAGKIKGESAVIAVAKAILEKEGVADERMEAYRMMSRQFDQMRGRTPYGSQHEQWYDSLANWGLFGW